MLMCFSVYFKDRLLLNWKWHYNEYLSNEFDTFYLLQFCEWSSLKFHIIIQETIGGLVFICCSVSFLKYSDLQWIGYECICLCLFQTPSVPDERTHRQQSDAGRFDSLQHHIAFSVQPRSRWTQIPTPGTLTHTRSSVIENQGLRVWVWRSRCVYYTLERGSSPQLLHSDSPVTDLL